MDVNDSDVLSQMLQEIKSQIDNVRSDLSGQKESLTSLTTETTNLSGKIDKIDSDQKENLSFLTTKVSFLEMTNRSINIPDDSKNRFGPRGEAAGESRRDWVRERYYRR